MQKMVGSVARFILALVTALSLVSCGNSDKSVKEFEDVALDGMGMNVHYWLSDDDILIGESQIVGGQKQGVQFARQRPGVFQKTPLPELTQKIGANVVRWYLSPDRQCVLALLKEGKSYSFATVNLDGSKMQTWKAMPTADFYGAWLPDSRHWVEFQETLYGKEKDNVLIHDREQPASVEKYTLPVQRVRMMTRQYQSIFDGYRLLDSLVADWALQNRKGHFHLQIKDIRAEKPPLKELALTAPENYSICGLSLSPNRTVLAWVCYLLGQEPGAKGKPALAVFFTRLDTKETKKAFEQEISLDNYYKTDWDKYVLPTWTPGGKRFSFFIEGKFQVIDYTQLEKNPPPDSAALPLQ